MVPEKKKKFPKLIGVLLDKSIRGKHVQVAQAILRQGTCCFTWKDLYFNPPPPQLFGSCLPPPIAIQITSRETRKKLRNFLFT